MIGLIGGSGIYRIEGSEVVSEHQVKTPFGNPSDSIVEMKVDGVTVFFIPRHGRNHSLLPHEINYRANIFALKKIGVRYLISLSAVGSLQENYPPGTFVCPKQFIDWTKGLRARSFFGEGMVGHVSVAHPVDENLRTLLVNSCQDVGIPYFDGGIYLCIEGPQFSSQAESHMYRSLGASVIGMTNVPESYLAKEAGMAYATAAMVTDFDCWREEHCNVEQILETMKENNENARRLLKSMVRALAERPFEVKTENEVGVMTPRERLNPRLSEILDVLLHSP